jgi:hypothetical protein
MQRSLQCHCLRGKRNREGPFTFGPDAGVGYPAGNQILLKGS